jgi:Flp pilus assembly protein TadG
MRRRNSRGVAIIEFAFAMLLLVPMTLGTIAIGLNVVQYQQTVQLARDAGYMYARQLDFTQTANQTLIAGLGGGVGLSTTPDSSNAVLILSTVNYVDSAICQSDNKWNTTTNQPNGCTNYQQWVFSQRIVIGNSNIWSSNFGSPVTTGSNPVTIASNGKISLDAQVTNSGDVAICTTTGGVHTFAGINPYASTNGNASGLPSGQMVYVAEAASYGFSMPPFPVSVRYSYNLF